MASFTKGQRVRFTNGSRFEGQLGTVEKVLPKNIDVLLDNGGGVRANPYFLTADLDGPGPTLPPPALVPVVGAVVRAADPRIDGLYVVIGDGIRNGRTIAKIAKLGGDGNRFWRVAPKDLTVVSLEELELGVEA